MPHPSGKKIQLVRLKKKWLDAAVAETLGACPWYQELTAKEAANKAFKKARAGDTQPDGSICAGRPGRKDPKLFTAPADALTLMDLNEAEQYVQASNEARYLGHDDWRIPTRKELDLLYENRNQGALAGSFNTHDNRKHYHRSATPWNKDTRYIKWFHDGGFSHVFREDKAIIRLVRSVNAW